MGERESDVRRTFRRVVRAVDPHAELLKGEKLGWPDWLVFWSHAAPWGPGLSFVELKTWDGKLSRIQRHVHERTEKRLGVAPCTLYGSRHVEEWVPDEGIPRGTVLFS